MVSEVGVVRGVWGWCSSPRCRCKAACFWKLPHIAKTSSCSARKSQYVFGMACAVALREAASLIRLSVLPQFTPQHLYATCLPSSPTALSSLQHLHTVSWLGAIDGPRPLPGGPWLAGLRRLVLSSCILSSAASLTTLSSAQQLERLGVFDTHVGVPIYGRKVLRRVLHILQWAQQHTSLQLLALDSTLRGAAAAAATAAMQQRPGLQIKPAADVDVVVCDYLQDSVHDQIY